MRDDTAVDYAKVREQFGRPIGSFQAVKHICAQMLIRAEQAPRVTAADAARAADGRHRAAASVAAAAAAAAGIGSMIGNAKDAIQVLGGIGFTWEHDAHPYSPRLRHRATTGRTAEVVARNADLAASGIRRRLGVDLRAVEEQRAGIAAEIADIAALPRTRRASVGWPRRVCRHRTGSALACQHHRPCSC